MLLVIIRAFLLYLLIILALRLMGKRQIGELQPSELVVTILISNIASLPIEDVHIPMSAGVFPILSLVFFEVAISMLTLRCKRIRRLVSGSPMILIRDGEIDQKQMRRLRFSVDDLMAALREKDVFDLNEVNYAIVETTGKVNLLLKHNSQTVTAQMLHLNGEDETPAVVMISDGVVITTALSAYGFNTKWLQRILRKEEYEIKDIFLMTADKQGRYVIVPRDTPQKRAAAVTGNCR